MNKLLKFSAPSIKQFARSGPLYVPKTKFTTSYLHQIHSIQRFSTFNNPQNNPNEGQDIKENPHDKPMQASDIKLAKDNYNKGMDLLKTNPKESLACFESYLELIKPYNNHEKDQLYAHLNIGSLHSMESQYKEALPHYQEALNLGLNLKHLEGQIKAHAYLAEAYNKLASMNVYPNEEVEDKIHEHFRKAIQLNVKLNGSYFERLAAFLQPKFDYANLEAELKKVLEMASKANKDDKKSLSKYYVMIIMLCILAGGTVYTWESNRFLQNKYKKYKKLKGEFYIRLGNNLYDAGHKKESIFNYQKAFQLEDEFIPDLPADKLDEIGAGLYSLKDFESSLKAYISPFSE